VTSPDWRPIADRELVDEVFIPIGNSPRSRAILAEMLRRRGGDR